MYRAYRAKTMVWFAGMVLATIAAPGCKPRVTQQNANREESRQKPARWLAQYRPARSLTETGNYLALYSFNSISIVSRDVICVAADLPDPNDKTRRVAL